jgi:hypothetical protein
VRLCAGPAHYAFANSQACFFRSKLRRGTRSSAAGCLVPSCWCLVCLSGSDRRYEMNQQSKVDSRGFRPSTWASDGRTATCEARMFRTDAVWGAVGCQSEEIQSSTRVTRECLVRIKFCVSCITIQSSEYLNCIRSSTRKEMLASGQTKELRVKPICGPWENVCCISQRSNAVVWWYF